MIDHTLRCLAVLMLLSATGCVASSFADPSGRQTSLEESQRRYTHLHRIPQPYQRSGRLLKPHPQHAWTPSVGKAAHPPHGKSKGAHISGSHGQGVLDFVQLRLRRIPQELERQVDPLRPHPAHASGRNECSQMVLQRYEAGLEFLVQLYRNEGPVGHHAAIRSSRPA